MCHAPENLQWDNGLSSLVVQIIESEESGRMKFLYSFRRLRRSKGTRTNTSAVIIMILMIIF